MNITKSFDGINVSIIVLATTVLMGCSSNNPTNAPQLSPEGMALEISTRSTLAYKKEEVDFSTYNKVQILPSKVAFKKNWQRNYNRSQSSLSRRINDQDVIQIKEKVANLFDDVFKEEFGHDDTFPLVNKVTSNTLVIRPAIINLTVTSPAINTSSNMNTYISEAGKATLFIELYDGVSGEILARIISASVAGDHSYYNWASRASNHADAKRMIKTWAEKLKVAFDEAQVKKNK